MAETAQPFEEIPRPDLSHLITEDDEPVDNWFQERQQRLLPESLYASWKAWAALFWRLMWVFSTRFRNKPWCLT